MLVKFTCIGVIFSKPRYGILLFLSINVLNDLKTSCNSFTDGN